MYTRSFGNPKYATVTTLPPDYGGTSIGQRQEDAQPPGRNAITAHKPESPQPRKGHDDRRPRFPVSHEILSEPERGYVGAPPFGEGEGVVSSDEYYDETDALPLELVGEAVETAASEKRPSLLGGLFGGGGEGMKSDDLLLLGLIFMMFKDGDNGDMNDSCREAMIMLAILYISGM